MKADLEDLLERHGLAENGPELSARIEALVGQGLRATEIRGIIREETGREISQKVMEQRIYRIMKRKKAEISPAPEMPQEAPEASQPAPSLAPTQEPPKAEIVEPAKAQPATKAKRESFAEKKRRGRPPKEEKIPEPWCSDKLKNIIMDLGRNHSPSEIADFLKTQHGLYWTPEMVRRKLQALKVAPVEEPEPADEDEEPATPEVPEEDRWPKGST